MGMEDQHELNLYMLACLGYLKLKNVEISESVESEIEKKFIEAISDEEPEWSVRKMRSPMKRRLNSSVIPFASLTISEPDREPQVVISDVIRAVKKQKTRVNDIAKKQSTNRKKKVPEGPEPPPEMPTRMRGVIGTENESVRLILQKKISHSDVEKNQNRLLMPIMQLREAEFLTDAEVNEASRKKGKRIPGLRVRILDPQLTELAITFKKWDMASSSNYLFNDTWSALVEANGINEDDVIQVWFYRDAHGSPCFALVNLTSPLD